MESQVRYILLFVFPCVVLRFEVSSLLKQPQLVLLPLFKFVVWTCLLLPQSQTTSHKILPRRVLLWEIPSSTNLPKRRHDKSCIISFSLQPHLHIGALGYIRYPSLTGFQEPSLLSLSNSCSSVSLSPDVRDSLL